MRKTNGYGWFTAEYCKSTGLPMYDKKTYAAVADRYLSKTRCAEIKKPVNEGENPVAFYRVDRGYCGLYLREKGGEGVMAELLPCPFCGNKAIFIGETRSIKCTKCGGAFVVANPLISRLEVAMAWNTRTPQR